MLEKISENYLNKNADRKLLKKLLLHLNFKIKLFN